MDMSLSAPKIIPRLPFNKLYDIIVLIIIRCKITLFKLEHQEIGVKRANERGKSEKVKR